MRHLFLRKTFRPSGIALRHIPYQLQLPRHAAKKEIPGPTGPGISFLVAEAGSEPATFGVSLRASCGARLGLRQARPPWPCRPLRPKNLPASATGGGRIFCPTSPPVVLITRGAQKNRSTRWLTDLVVYGAQKNT